VYCQTFEVSKVQAHPEIEMAGKHCDQNFIFFEKNG
jgi:hypothetical protein